MRGVQIQVYLVSIERILIRRWFLTLLWDSGSQIPPLTFSGHSFSSFNYVGEIYNSLKSWTKNVHPSFGTLLRSDILGTECTSAQLLGVCHAGKVFLCKVLACGMLLFRLGS